MYTKRMQRSWLAGVLLTAAPLGLLASAIDEEQVVVRNDNTTVTVVDLQAELAGMDTRRRQMAVANPDNMRGLAENILIFRSLAKMAEDQGLHEDTDVVARLRLAYEKALGQILLEHAEGELDQEALKQLARAEFRANPERYQRGERILASHILIAVNDERDENAARDKAATILARLQDGEDFESLAREFSDDPGSRGRGGSLGLVERGRTVPEFEQALLAIDEPGELSEPVKSRFGYHVIRLDSYTPGENVLFEDVVDEIMRSLSVRILNDRRQVLVDPIRDPEQMVVDMDAIVELINHLQEE